MSAQPMLICDRLEVEFLKLYRRSDAADKKRLDKALHAGVKGLLPSAEKVKSMSAAEVRAMVDSWPEALA